MNYLLRISAVTPLVLLVGCGGGGGDGAGEGQTPAPGTATVMRLRGDFSIQNDYSLVGKPSAAGAKSVYSNKFSAQGSVDQLVTVSADAASGELTFRPSGTTPMAVTATVSEIGHCETANPDDATIAATVGDSSFSGPVSSPVDYSLRASALGAGDEFSFRMSASAKGAATFSTTAANGNVQTADQICPGLPSILTRPPGGPSDAATLSTSHSWSIFPTLGSRPAGAADQALYDAIAQNPTSVHLGLATSAARDHWTYTGTKVIANTDTQYETTRWTETIVINWRLEKP